MLYFAVSDGAGKIDSPEDMLTSGVSVCRIFISSDVVVVPGVTVSDGLCTSVDIVVPDGFTVSPEMCPLLPVGS